MREAFDDALVSGWEELEGGLSLPDQGDRHVLAAAIRGGAQAIITANAKDFPAAAQIIPRPKDARIQGCKAMKSVT